MSVPGTGYTPITGSNNWGAPDNEYLKLIALAQASSRDFTDIQNQLNSAVLGSSNATIGAYPITASGTNTYTGTFSGLTYFIGLFINLLSITDNTGASTFNLNGLGAKSIKVRLTDGTLRDVQSGELHDEVSLIYDGTQFVVIQSDAKEAQRKIDNSYTMDLVKSYGEVKDIIPFEQSEDTGITLTGGAYGTTGLKIGADSYGADNVGANKVFTASFTAKDLSKLNNDSDSTAEDYITLPITITGTLPTAIRLELSSNVGAIDVNDFNQDLVPVTSFQVLKFKKTSFTQTGSPNWNSIGYIRITSVGGDATTDIWFDKMQLVKADPSLTYPNPLASQGWAINSNEYYVVKEFEDIKLINLSNTTDLNALEKTTLYPPTFTITRIFETKTANNAPLFGWFKDDNNYVLADINVSSFRLLCNKNGVTTSNTVPLTCNIGDTVNITIKGNVTKFEADISVNGKFIEILKVVGVDYSDLLGKFVLSNISSKSGSILSASITNIAHAHHADIAEVAKGLTEQAMCKVKSVAFQSIPTTTSALVVWDTEDVDNKGSFDFVNNRYVIPETGFYDILALINFAGNSTGYRTVQIRKNGTPEVQVRQAVIPDSIQVQVSDGLYLTKGNYVDITVVQTSGFALNIGGAFQQFSITKRW